LAWGLSGTGGGFSPVDLNGGELIFLLGGMSALILVVIFAAPVIGENVQAFYPPVEGATNPQAVGLILFTKYLVPFEVAAIMLLVAMISGIVLAGKKMDLSLTLYSTAEIKDMKKDQDKKVLS